MSADIKRSKSQISKIIQSGEFARGMLGSLCNIGKGLGKKSITDLAVL